MRTIKITLWYDGTNFSGWQRQDDRRTVQAVLEDVIATIEGKPVTAIGAGRTDAGVHAAAQVASVDLESALPAGDLQRAINARLPDDLRVRMVEDAPAGFNARRDAFAKTYRYGIWNGTEPNPFIRHVVWHVAGGLDLAAMIRAAAILEGEHDFAAFQAAGSNVATSVRRLTRSELREWDLDAGQPLMPGATAPGARLLCYEVSGTGFLRHMVRAIVGTLVDIGRGRWPADDMAGILSSRDRARAGRTAPPQGLMLWRVDY